MTKIQLIQNALKSTEIIKENGQLCGVVPALPGVWAIANTEPELFRLLTEAAETWLEAKKIEGLGAD